MFDDDIFGKDLNKDKKETPAEDPNAKVLESITSLKDELQTINSRLDEFDTKITDMTTVNETPEETDKNWRPKTWDEIPQKAEEIANQVVDQKLSEKEKQQHEAEEVKLKQEKQMDTFIDNQLSELEKNKVLPAVENPSDENDPGRAARRELLGFAGRIGTLDLNKASEVLNILHETGRTYDPRANNMQGEFLKSNTTPVGINAPVASSNRPIGNVPNKLDYKTLHNASMDSLIKSVMPDY